ncbi:MAG: hypothetical protein KatS3mg102_0455 [Planctomycetota bacterium]|nr:MAG: hypothetical protein KatS3mg102_0455 [Planctomycetota bacterium]
MAPKLTLGSLLCWEAIGAGRRLIHCRRCGSPIELRLMDDLLEVACPGCGRQPLFEACHDFEAAAGTDAARQLLLSLGIASEDEIARALELAGGEDPEVSAEDPRSGLIGAARALGLFRKSLYLSVDETAAGGGEPLRLRPLAELVTPEQLAEAVEVECTSGTPSGEVIASLVLAAEKEKQYALPGGVEAVELDRLTVEEEARRLVPAGLAASYLVVPVRLEGERLVVAMRDPLDYELIDNLKFVIGREIKAVAAPEDALLRALERLFPDEELREDELPDPASELPAAETELSAAELALLQESQLSEPTAAELEAAGMPEEPAGLRTLNLLLLQAAEERAEALLLEPLELTWRARLRRGGRLRDVALLEREAGQAVLEQLLVRAGIGGGARAGSGPRAGRLELRLGGETAQYDVAIAPGAFGPVAVVRGQPEGFRATGLEALCLVPGDAALARTLLRTAPGLVVVSGPAGSGKTALLYALCREADRLREHLVMLERKTRAQLEGVAQFAAADYTALAPLIRAAQPERLYVDDLFARPEGAAEPSEVRMALELAAAGGQVVVSVPAADPLAAVARLAIAAGVEAAGIAHLVQALVTVRLVRRLCPRCRQEFEPEPELCARLGLGEEVRRLSVGVGCWECTGSGYSGRAALIELVPVRNEALRGPLARLEAETWRRAAEQAGAVLLRTKALRALRAGLTSAAQVRALL